MTEQCKNKNEETTQLQDNVVTPASGPEEFPQQAEHTDSLQDEAGSQREADRTDDFIKGAIETLLFISENPVSLEQIRKALETVTVAEIKRSLESLSDNYNQSKRGMIIREIAGGYQMLSNSMYAPYVKNFYKTKHKEKLSNPALECLAIIAYKQPVTRADIELIRGVNSDGIVSHLTDKELIKVVGRRDVPGKPFLLGTTKRFLEYFGLKSLDQLPRLEEFPALAEKTEGMNADQERVRADIPPADEVLENDAVAEETKQNVQPSEDHPRTEASDEINLEDQMDAEQQDVLDESNHIHS
ncbi:MAG: SMC-Scp complex subunit ScpB [Candidatus Omnitrophica bacterium]|nr:SMC-Scp complex subunit ScpB [Candidatus Omnitrophota bacterium]